MGPGGPTLGLSVKKKPRHLRVKYELHYGLENLEINKAANKANKRLGVINRNFKCKARKVILPLYKSIVRPHLDYCVQAW